MIDVAVGGTVVTLLPDKAAWLPEHHTLLVADLHLGKAMSFRRWGVAVPRGSTSESLARLSVLIDRHQARRVVFLGDFLHSARARAPATLQVMTAWRERHAPVQLTLVRGNHDRHAGDPPAVLGIEGVEEPLRLGGLALCHHPQAVEGAYAVAGHLHPCVRVGAGLDRFRLPCFWFGKTTAVLPAFGSFTGMHRVQPEPGDHLVAVADGRLVALG